MLKTMYMDIEKDLNFESDLCFVSGDLECIVASSKIPINDIRIDYEVEKCEIVNVKTNLYSSLEKNNNEEFLNYMAKVKSILKKHIVSSKRQDIKRIMILLNVIDIGYVNCGIHIYCENEVLKPIGFTSFTSPIFR